MTVLDTLALAAWWAATVTAWAYVLAWHWATGGFQRAEEARA
jgi:hypothetical protein